MSPTEDFLMKIRGEFPKDYTESLIKAFTVRANAAVYGRLFALSEMAKTSVNDTAVEMICNGMDGIYEALTEEEQEQCEALTVQWLQSFVKEQREGGKL